ncbi:(2Fe-2S)-binding protein [Bradyrhizobium prioriisuperbiae]|uniref:(2Fe-2S)-binding protein n=1 Tax=Bradyrhizobium prioriisuperbiae TaxID=2854389 RepID=UPI0028E5E74B|nr:2Fe-2S iron-sulfur cluster-binding protein [Bradyrhizobium prioritasuperba]
MSSRMTVNGKTHVVQAEPGTPLLYVLRNDLGLNGPKFGCGLGQCGACTVVIAGEAVRSCSTPLSAIGDDNVTTLEGLGSQDKPHPLQKAFLAEQAAQCGYCSNGMIMAAKALLDRERSPSEDVIKQTLADHLCRCGVHNRIVRAVRRAATELAL